MGIIASRNDETTRKEQDGVVYFDRGIVQGANGRRYLRFAIQTHFVGRKESQGDLVERYVRPLYKDGDCLSFGAKVMAMCVDSVKSRDEVKPGFWANRLWRFAGINHTGVGMHEPYKLQLVIDMVGLPRVLLGAAVAAVTRPFGVHGLFYKICGQGVGGIDGFYFRSSFDIYKQLALINPPDPVGICNRLYAETGIPVVLMDANDLQRDELGVSDGFPLTYEERQDALADNPSGQGDELTPLILVRPL